MYIYIYIYIYVYVYIYTYYVIIEHAAEEVRVPRRRRRRPVGACYLESTVISEVSISSAQHFTPVAVLPLTIPEVWIENLDES